MDQSVRRVGQDNLPFDHGRTVRHVVGEGGADGEIGLERTAVVVTGGKFRRGDRRPYSLLWGVDDDLMNEPGLRLCSHDSASFKDGFQIGERTHTRSRVLVNPAVRDKLDWNWV